MATTKKLTPEEKLISTALATIEKSGWKSLSLIAVARKAKIDAATLYDLCPTNARCWRSSPSASTSD